MSSFTNLHPDVAASILTAEDISDLANVTDPQEGDIRYVKDVDLLYTYNGSAWIASAGGGVQPPSPAVSTDEALVRWDGTDASTLQDSLVTITDAGGISGATQLQVGDLTLQAGSISNSTSEIILDAGANFIAVDSNLTFRNGKDLRFQDNDNSNTVTISIPAVVTADRTPQIPDDTGNFTLTTASQTLTNKTMVAANNTITTAASGNLTATELNTALSELQSDIDTRELVSNKGISGGYASLDGGGKVPVGQLPATLMTYEGTWDASTNTPTLANGTGDAGMVYIVNVAGTVDFGAGNITFSVGDWVIYNGTIWQKSDNADDVMSVNGYTGVVILGAADVAALPYYANTGDNTLVRTDGVGGDAVQGSSVTLSDGGAITGATSISVDSLSLTDGRVNTSSGPLRLNAASNQIFVDADLTLRDNTPLVFLDADGSNSITISIPAVVTVSRNPQIPDDTGNFVLTTAAQTLTNKSIVASQLTGTVAIANGGTGQSTAQLAINALAGSVTDNRVLQGNGTNIVLGQIDSTDFFTTGAIATSTQPGLIPFYIENTFTPAPTAVNDVISLGAVSNARYTKIGRLVFFEFTIAATVLAATSATHLVGFTLPVAAAASDVAMSGSVSWYSSGTVNARGNVNLQAATGGAGSTVTARALFQSTGVLVSTSATLWVAGSYTSAP